MGSVYLDGKLNSMIWFKWLSPKSTFDGGNLVDLKENPAPEDVEDLEKLPKKENPNRIENHAFLTEMTIGKALKLENKKDRKKFYFLRKTSSFQEKNMYLHLEK